MVASDVRPVSASFSRGSGPWALGRSRAAGIILCTAFLVVFGGEWGGGVTVASADEGFYLSGRTGLVVLGDFDDITLDNIREIDFKRIEFKTGLGLMGALGYDFGIIRLEGEFGYSKNDLDRLKFDGGSVDGDGDVTDVHLLFNVFADIPNPTPLVPYVGAGLGASYTSVNKVGFDDIDLIDDGTAVFAFQVGAGVGYEVSDSVTVEVGYRYFATGDPSLTDERGVDVDVEHSSHNLTLGLRFTF